MNTFFYGFDNSVVDRIFANLDILVSTAFLIKRNAAGIYNFFPPGHIENVRSIFLDSGGFRFYARYKKYPFSPDEYISYINKFTAKYPQTKYVSIMDFPCELTPSKPSINKERIDKTVNNARILLDKAIPSQWVSIVQGYSIPEYQYCFDKLKENGLITPLIAVGGLWGRQSTSDTYKVIRNMWLQHKKLHGFGVSFHDLANLSVWNMLYSSDSGAWRFRTRIRGRPNWFYGTKQSPRGRRPSTHIEKKENFYIYKSKIDALFSKYGRTSDEN